MFERIKQRFFNNRSQGYQGLSIESSAVCNLRCSHCPLRTYQDRTGARHMSTETVRAIIPHLEGIDDLDLTGWGEPFMNPRFLDNLELIRSAYHGRIGFTTNGTLLDERAIDRLLAAGVDTVCFSVDAPDQASYKRLRAGGDFERVISVLARLVSKKRESAAATQVFASYLIRRDTMDEIHRFVRRMQDLGLDGVVFQHMTGVFSEPGLSDIAYSGYYGTGFDDASLKAVLEEAAQMSGPGFSVLMPERIGDELVMDCGGFNLDKPFISAAGDVTVCCRSCGTNATTLPVPRADCCHGTKIIATTLNSRNTSSRLANRQAMREDCTSFSAGRRSLFSFATATVMRPLQISSVFADTIVRFVSV